MAQTVQGLITKSLGGFYYVQVQDEEYETRAKGGFRNEGIKPCVGDVGTVEVQANHKGSLVQIAPRKNILVRPPLANLDQLVLVNSVIEPVPNYLVLDKMIAICQYKDLAQMIVITKSDLNNTTEMEDIYKQAGFEVYVLSNKTGEGVEAVKDALAGKISAFCGNSGVGKSSLLNSIDSRFTPETAGISHKLGRGKHTTRHVELYLLDNGGYVADTPGFSSVDLERCEVIRKEELQYCFRELVPLIPKCRYTGCSHTKEQGCAVLEALQQGKISNQRHQSYLAMYEVSKQMKEWEIRK